MGSARVWSLVYVWYWRLMLVICLPTVALQIAFGGHSSKMGASVYLATTVGMLLLSKYNQKWVVPLHLFMALVIGVWQVRQPIESTAPAWSAELLGYVGSSMAALSLYTMSVLGSWPGLLATLVLMVGFLPHPESPFWWWVVPFWLFCGLLGLLSRYGISYVQDLHGWLEQMALKDHLTNLGNRRAFETEYLRYQTLAGRNNQPLLLSLWDVDGLKQVNDLEGHDAGDAYLQRFSVALQECVRQNDAVFRTGGDEFCALHIDLEEGQEMVERVRRRFPNVSVGYIECSSLDIAKAYQTADQLLYSNKKERGRITQAEESTG